MDTKNTPPHKVCDLKNNSPPRHATPTQHQVYDGLDNTVHSTVCGLASWPHAGGYARGRRLHIFRV